MTAKEWIFENYPQVKEEWNKTGHGDNYMVRMMEEYHQAKLKEQNEKLLYSPEDIERIINKETMFNGKQIRRYFEKQI